MGLKRQRKLAAEILKVGESRVWIDPTKIEDVSAAITREDIRGLIDRGIIRALPRKGVSRARVKKRKRGPGSIKGARGARTPKKRAWITKIRALRRHLRHLRDEGAITRSTYRILYRMAKGCAFRSKAHLDRYIDEQGLRREN